MNDNGPGTTSSASYPGLPENRTISIRACTGNVGFPVRCADWFSGTS